MASLNAQCRGVTCIETDSLGYGVKKQIVDLCCRLNRMTNIPAPVADLLGPVELKDTSLNEDQ